VTAWAAVHQSKPAQQTVRFRFESFSGKKNRSRFLLLASNIASKTHCRIMAELVSVHKIAEAFAVSARQVQKFCIFENMPGRDKHGKYDYEKCLLWFAARLHRQVCGCGKDGDGPCDGWDAESREVTNRRAEREAALRGIVELAPKLAGKKAAAIRERLSEAIDSVYGEK
jgi:hypothetical protein